MWISDVFAMRNIMIEIQISVFFLHFKKLKYFLVEFTTFEICSTEQKAFCFLQLSFHLSQQFVGEGGIYKKNVQ